MTIDDVMELADAYADASTEFVMKGVAGSLDARVELRAAILALVAEGPIVATNDGPWKRAVIDGLMVSHCYRAEHEADPRAALNALLCWERAVALDPCVSSDAVALLDAEAEACIELCQCYVRMVDSAEAIEAIRARIAGRKA